MGTPSSDFVQNLRVLGPMGGVPTFTLSPVCRLGDVSPGSSQDLIRSCRDRPSVEGIPADAETAQEGGERNRSLNLT